MHDISDPNYLLPTDIDRFSVPKFSFPMFPKCPKSFSFPIISFPIPIPTKKYETENGLDVFPIISDRFQP